MRAPTLRHDPVLTGLARAADPQAVRELLAPHFTNGVRIEDVVLHDFAYRPQRAASFVYELGLRDERGDRHRHFMHAWLGPAARTRRRHARLRERRWMSPRFGPAFLLLPELDSLVFGFPNDTKLRLEGLSDAARVLDTFRAHAILSAAAQRCESSIVHYVPHKRLVMRHALEPGEAEIYTKSYGHGRGASVFTTAQVLWEHGRVDADAFTIATPLGYLPKARTLVQEGLRGWTHQDYAAWVRAPACMRALGRGLARIHTSDLRLEATWGPEQELARFNKVADLVGRFDPSLTAAIDALRQLAQRGAAAAGSRQVPIHGAFRLRQVLTRDERVALVDLDGFRNGDPLSDLGSLVAQLQARVATGRLQAPEAGAAADAFLTAYRSGVPWSSGEAALAWYVGLRLFSRHVMGPMNHLKRNAHERIALLVDASRRILETRNAAFQ